MNWGMGRGKWEWAAMGSCLRRNDGEGRRYDEEGVRVPACAGMTEGGAEMTSGARALRMLRVCALRMVLSRWLPGRWVLGRWLRGRWSGLGGWLGVGCRLCCGTMRGMRAG